MHKRTSPFNTVQDLALEIMEADLDHFPTRLKTLGRLDTEFRRTQLRDVKDNQQTLKTVESDIANLRELISLRLKTAYRDTIDFESVSMHLDIARRFGFKDDMQLYLLMKRLIVFIKNMEGDSRDEEGIKGQEVEPRLLN